MPAIFCSCGVLAEEDSPLPIQLALCMINASSDTLTMKMVSGGDRKRLQYQVFVPSPKISTICEGGFEAKAVEVNGKPCIEFHAPALFQSGVGKVLVIFTFGNNAAAVSVVRSFYFKREE